eukprot:1182911-Prorocentrum_minimum.AAC.10
MYTVPSVLRCTLLYTSLVLPPPEGGCEHVRLCGNVGVGLVNDKLRDGWMGARSGWWHEVFTVHGAALAVNSFLEAAPLTRLRPTILHLASDRFAKWVESESAVGGADAEVNQGADSVAEVENAPAAEGTTA